MTRICIDFAIAYLVAIIGLLAIGIALEEMSRYQLPPFAVLAVAIAAALYAGHKYAHRSGLRPRNGFAWIASVWMTLTALGISLALFALMFFVIGENSLHRLRQLLSTLPNNQLKIALVAGLVGLVVEFPAIRFFFGMGAKQAANAIDQTDIDRF